MPAINHTREPVNKGQATSRGQTGLFSNHFFLFPLISSIKSFTGTKCISTIICRNRKACIFCTFSIPSNDRFRSVVKQTYITLTESTEMHWLWLLSRQYLKLLKSFRIKQNDINLQTTRSLRHRKREKTNISPQNLT